METENNTNQLVLSLISDTASKGQLTPALLALDAWEQEGNVEANELLRAKILAQKGDYSSAIQCWQSVLSNNPDNREAKAGIKKARYLKANGFIRSLTQPKVKAGFMTGILCLGLVSLLYPYASDSTLGSESLKSDKQLMLTVTPAINDKTGKLDKNIIELSEKEFKVPGVQVHKDKKYIVLKFDEGIFTTGTIIRSDASDTLQLLGKKLNKYANVLQLLVVGHTDNIPVPGQRDYRDNIALGMARSAAVIDKLRQVTKLPHTAFQAQTTGETKPVFPNDTKQARKRNRTVVIYISKYIEKKKKAISHK